MKNKILVQICDKEYSLITEEAEDYVKKLSDEITKMIDATAYKNLRTSKLDAALITCLELCDKNHKISEDNDNMRREILEYIDDIGKLNKKLTALERQKSTKKPITQENNFEKADTTENAESLENTGNTEKTENTEEIENTEINDINEINETTEIPEDIKNIADAEINEPEEPDEENESFTPNTPVYRKF